MCEDHPKFLVRNWSIKSLKKDGRLQRISFSRHFRSNATDVGLNWPLNKMTRVGISGGAIVGYEMYAWGEDCRKE